MGSAIAHSLAELGKLPGWAITLLLVFVSAVFVTIIVVASEKTADCDDGIEVGKICNTALGQRVHVLWRDKYCYVRVRHADGSYGAYRPMEIVQ